MSPWHYVRGAVVKVSNNGIIKTTYTNENGGFSFDGLLTGPAHVIACVRNNCGGVDTYLDPGINSVGIVLNPGV
jgi:hypothetical protein